MRGRVEVRMEIKRIKRQGVRGGVGKGGREQYLGRNWSLHFWDEIIRDSRADI